MEGKNKMNWKNLFSKKAIVTAADRAELEGLEKNALDLKQLSKPSKHVSPKITMTWPPMWPRQR